MPSPLQWGGRFAGSPDATLLAFGSSLEDDLVLAPFDVRTSQAHVDALLGGAIIDESRAAALDTALATVADEIASGSFEAFARASGAEDVHGAIDARVREIDGVAGEWLHSGRSRNDQVATTLALYVHDRAHAGAQRVIGIARYLTRLAATELDAQTVLASTTHWQPAQPVLLAFWLLAAAEPFVRAARRLSDCARNAKRFSPLGSGAVAGSTLPLDRHAAAAHLGFEQPSRNAMDTIGTRDTLLDVASAFARASIDASRIASELTVWATPAFGYVRLGDASSTGSSLMPQKRNPDIFELVRGGASDVLGSYTAALGTLTGLPLSYHRDLQQTKRLGITAVERALALLQAFDLALRDTTFVRDAMNARANDGYVVATDISDALIGRGCSARQAHALAGAAVLAAEREGRALDARDLASIAAEAKLEQLNAPLDPLASVNAKATAGSTAPHAVRDALAAIVLELETLEGNR